MVSLGPLITMPLPMLKVPSSLIIKPLDSIKILSLISGLRIKALPSLMYSVMVAEVPKVILFATILPSVPFNTMLPLAEVNAPSDKIKPPIYPSGETNLPPNSPSVAIILPVITKLPSTMPKTYFSSILILKPASLISIPS
jgi:hypothetical protein